MINRVNLTEYPVGAGFASITIKTWWSPGKIDPSRTPNHTPIHPQGDTKTHPKIFFACGGHDLGKICTKTQCHLRPRICWARGPAQRDPLCFTGTPDPSGTQGPPKTSKQPQKHLTPPGIELGTTSAPCMAPGRISPRSYIELPLLSVLTESPAIWECAAGAHGRTCVEGTPRAWQLPLSCRSPPGL